MTEYLVFCKGRGDGFWVQNANREAESADDAIAQSTREGDADPTGQWAAVSVRNWTERTVRERTVRYIVVGEREFEAIPGTDTSEPEAGDGEPQ